MSNHMKAIACLAIAVCLAVATPAQAQTNCQSISLLLQANLSFDKPIPYIGWSGIVRGFLNDQTPLNGMLYGAGPGGGFFSAGQTGHELDGSFVLDFGTMGKFVTLPDKGIFPVSPQVAPHMTYPPPLAWSPYFYTAKIAPPAPTAFIQASGWFENATGSLALNGMFAVNGPTPLVEVPDGPNTKGIGIWNAEIKGRLCGVTPK